MDHIGSVLVQCSRKWDRDSKQIQIACYCFRACGWPALQTEYSNRFWFNGPNKGDDPAGNIWATLLSVKKYNIKIGPMALGWKIIKVELSLCRADTWQENQIAHTQTHTPTDMIKTVFLYENPYYAHCSTFSEHINMFRFYFANLGGH